MQPPKVVIGNRDDWIPVDHYATLKPDHAVRQLYVSGLLVSVRLVVLSWDIPPVVLATGRELPLGLTECYWLTINLWREIVRQVAAVEDGAGTVRDPSGAVTRDELLQRFAELDRLWWGGTVRQFWVPTLDPLA